MSEDPKIAALRAQIDRVNRELRDVVQRRACLVLAIARRKRALGLAIADPARERAMLADMLRAPGAGFDPPALEALLIDLLARYRALAEQSE